MFYRPESKETGMMWDTWLYFHAGRYYLYYLAKSGSVWDNISLATSADGVLWKEQGVILAKDADATWMGTGSTWANPDVPGRFCMNFSQERGKQQAIYFAESDDLVSWRALPAGSAFTPNERWYYVDKGNESRWDCIFTVPRDGGGLWGYWTASPIGRHGVGMGWTADGLAWDSLPPPEFDPPLAGSCEHGGVARVGKKYYHMIGCQGGMITYIADAPNGPLVRARRNADLLSAGVAEQNWTRMYTYFTRFFPSPSGLLVNHHAIGRDGTIYMGMLKRALVDAEGTMRLGWWEGNEAVKGQPLGASLATPTGAGARMIEGALPVERGIVLEGRVALPRAGASPQGVYIETEAGRGTGLFVGPGGVLDIGSVSAGGEDFGSDSRVNREWSFAPTVRFRLLLKRDILEFYQDELLMQCYSLPAPATGRVGVFGAVEDIWAWQANG